MTTPLRYSLPVNRFQWAGGWIFPLGDGYLLSMSSLYAAFCFHEAQRADFIR